MAATASRTGRLVVNGPGGGIIEHGIINFDSDATVEVKTSLSVIKSATLTPIGSAGGVQVASIDEPVVGSGADARILPANGSVTVDADGAESGSFFYQFIGF